MPRTSGVPGVPLCPTPAQVPFPSPPSAHGAPAPLRSPRTINPCPALQCCPWGCGCVPLDLHRRGLEGDRAKQGDREAFGLPRVPLWGAPGGQSGGLVPGSVPGAGAVLGDPYWGRCLIPWVGHGTGVSPREATGGSGQRQGPVPKCRCGTGASTVRLKEVLREGPGMLVPVQGQSRDDGAGTMFPSRGLEWSRNGSREACAVPGAVQDCRCRYQRESCSARSRSWSRGGTGGGYSGSGSVPGIVPVPEAVSETDPGVGADVRGGS